MEPRIQYAKTSDGVSIAFWTLGEGRPFVHTPQGAVSHIQEEWRDPVQRGWYEHLAENRMLVRYDPRGFGLSAREVGEFSLDAFVLDLEAVVNCLGLEEFVLYDISMSPVAIAYAAQHVERVSHLIMWSPWLRVSDVPRAELFPSLRELLDRDWESYTETWMHLLYGWESAELAHRQARRMRAAATANT